MEKQAKLCVRVRIYCNARILRVACWLLLLVATAKSPAMLNYLAPQPIDLQINGASGGARVSFCFRF